MEYKVNGDVAFAATTNQDHNAERPSVVFVHGAAMDHTVWVLPKRYFVRKGYNVYAIDLPGHGRSAGTPRTSIEAMADWVHEFTLAVGIETTAVVGHSMGSLVTLDFAARYPQTTRALVLLGTAVPMAVTDPLLNAAEAQDHLAFDMLNIWGHSKRAHYGGNPNPGMWMTGAGIRLLERSVPGALHTDLNACRNYTDGVERAASITCPTLLILGKLDAMTPPFVARDVAEAIEGSRTLMLKGSGHALMTERPDEVLDALIEIV